MPTAPLRLCALVSALLLAACATVPQPAVEGAVSQMSPAQALESGEVGQQVRWGGTILAVKPEKERTCFEVLSRPLDGSGRPEKTDKSYGRFLGCASGFYDPVVYRHGRDFTVVGRVEPATTGKVGDADYRYARLRIEKLYMWPPEPPELLIRSDPFYFPPPFYYRPRGWHPLGPWYGPYPYW